MRAGQLVRAIHRMRTDRAYRAYASLAYASLPPQLRCLAIAGVKVSNPHNLAMKHFDQAYYDKLSASDQLDLLSCINSGLENPDSKLGCYAMQPGDYDRFAPFFSKVVSDYHGVSEDAKHVNSWSLEGVEGVPADGVLDLGKLGLPKVSVRTRLGRNFKEFPLPGAMTKDDRIAMEKKLVTVFDTLIAKPGFGGKYYSLTPAHSNFIDASKHQELVDAQIMFKDLASDSYAISAGIAEDWPHGRGCYVSEDKGFIVWCGAEDHLSITSTGKTKVLNDVCDRITTYLDAVKSAGLNLAISEEFGAVTSCPTNIGGAMHASVDCCPIPLLTADGTDMKAKAIAEPFGVLVGGEHTPIVTDGTVDISLSAGFGMSESEVMASLYRGIARLAQKESNLKTIQEKVAAIRDVKVSYPDNLAMKHFDFNYYDKLSSTEKMGILQCVNTGIENPDSNMGCYAMQPADYDHYKPFFSKVLSEYHGVPEDAKHVNSWSLEGVEGVPADGILDLGKLGLPTLSVRARVGRNLEDFPLPGAMTKEDRIAMEEKLGKAFDTLIAKPGFGGAYYSLTPGHPKFINEEKYQELVDAHIMFKDMAADSYLASAGIASHWPHGRGCYVSEDKGFIIWCGEEDHLRIISIGKTKVLNDVFDRLKTSVEVVSSIPGLNFAISEEYGAVTSCPTNLGSAMRASVHYPIPSLTADGTDTKAKSIAKPYGLQVRGTGGEHTPIGADGTVDISPMARFCITEAEIITALYRGIAELSKKEKEAADLIAKVAAIGDIKVSNPDNLAVKHFNVDYYGQLSDTEKKGLLQCVNTGIENPDSNMGCYAMQPADYDHFKPFFSKVLSEYHGVPEDAKHVNSWSLKGVEGVPADGVLDLGKLGLPSLSVRARVGRNLEDFPLPGAMTKEDRVAMEEKLGKAFDTLISKPGFGGAYYSLTPGHQNFINEQKYQELVDAHIMFKDMAADSYLASAGIASHWPYGRGCYVSEDKGFIIWCGEEDHLRIISIGKTKVLNDVFDRLRTSVDVVSSIPGLNFAISEEYGAVTSCPTNLGSAMRASVHYPIPSLTADGTDTKAKAIAKPYGLQVRGTGGEHTPIGADGTVDISPMARFCITEAEIITALYRGIAQLSKKETEAAHMISQVAAISDVKVSNPDNLAMKHFNVDYYSGLSDTEKLGLLQCVNTGIENPDSNMGCYAMQPADYDHYKPFFSKVLSEYHGVPEDAKHVNSWSLEGVEGVPADGILDLGKLGLPTLSVRARVGRNLEDFPLPGAMTKEDRIAMEEKLGKAFDTLIAKPGFGGAYYSLTPGHPKFINEQKYQELVDAHIMFKDMAADSYLASAGIASHWPHGRGCYVSEDKGFIIWCGEEDHLRIISIGKTKVLNDVFDRLRTSVEVVSSIPGLNFAISEEYGAVTSCPTNLGSAMRASVHYPIPSLTADGTDTKAKAIAKPYGLQVRGTGGEHTPIGADGTVDISPMARFCITEAEIITALYRGIAQLSKKEMEAAHMIAKIAAISDVKVSNPDNLAAKHFNVDYYSKLSDTEKMGLLQCVNTGIENPDSNMGCYAMQPADYDHFKPFFSKVLSEYHGVPEDAKHVNSWSLEGVEGVPADGILDLGKLGLPTLSVRARVGRNLEDFPLPGAMTKEDRIAMEEKLGKAFDTLIAKPGFGGAYYSLTPGHPKFINEEKYQELVDAHIMFKDMAADSYLASAGIASHWPHGRGCYVSEDKGFIIWCGEEDHLRIISIGKTKVLNDVFDRLRTSVEVVSSIPGLNFAISDEYGAVTSCPTNLGSAMRASVHYPIPSLTADGTDTKAKAIAKPYGLQVRGTGGEHTPIGADGTVDISPMARFCITEAEIITALYRGIAQLSKKENEAAHMIAKTVAISDVKISNPDNLAMKYFNIDYYNKLSDTEKMGLLQCVNTGIENPDSNMGCYAMQPADYDHFKPFFSKVLSEYHGVPEDAKHVNSWSLKGVEGVPADGILDLGKLGLPTLSVRARVGRNLEDFPLPGAMTKEDRVAMEAKLGKAFDTLIAKPGFGGAYYSLTPGHPKFINEKKYQELVDAHIMFKDMAADSYLASAGIASHWPHGRGCYVSEDKGFIIWCGEEDHLRIISIGKTKVLNDVFDRLRTSVEVVSSISGLNFAISEEYGAVTSCPTNLGSAMRASVHYPIPGLTADGTDTKAKAIAKPYGLQVRGTGGEHTPIGADGTVDISPMARFCITEAEIITALYRGIAQLSKKENEATHLIAQTAAIRDVKVSNPDNLAIKHFNFDYYSELPTTEKVGLLQCVNTGIENPDSNMGCYAMQPSDYDHFKPFFSKVLSEYHGVPEDAKHVNSWSLDGVKGVPADGVLDLGKLGLPALSVRARVGRNLKDFPLPGAMTQKDRIAMEKKLGEAFDSLIAKPGFGGAYYSLTPGHPNFIDEKKYKELVDAHIMFKDMAADAYLASAGIASDWPHGRGCYVSEDKGFIIWCGEEDHLRIISIGKTKVLNDVFDRLKASVEIVSSIPGLDFAISDEYGAVTSCPTNLGSAMRASVHYPIPNLTADGTDTRAKAIARPYGLQVRGTGGEHTPIGADGTVDISPMARFCITEAEIITALYQGIAQLAKREEKAGVVGEKLEMINDIKVSNPDNLAVKHFNVDYFDGLAPTEKMGLLQCVNTGLENPNSNMGCYAMQPADYDNFKPFFSKVLSEYHGVPEDAEHVNSWSLDGVEGVPADGVLDLGKLGLPKLSVRARVGRNLKDFPLPGAMTKEDRISMEKKLGKAFDMLIAKPGFGGAYYSLTPGHPNHIDENKYQELVNAHIMFKDMAADTYLASAGIASHWPYGRGCYVSEDKGFIIWCGEEDHLRIISIGKTKVLNDVFDRLKTSVEVVSSIPGLDFAISEKYGAVTSCPTNLGSAMRASVHYPIPNLTADGTDAKAKAIAKPYGLQVRGTGGEHTPIGADGTVDISPMARFCITEAEIITALYRGIAQLAKKEETEGTLNAISPALGLWM